METDLPYFSSEPLSTSMDVNFFKFLRQLDCTQIKIFAQLEGSIVFPRVPLMRVEGPLVMVQLVETTLLTLVNYASLVATNAARHRLVAGDSATLLEFGLRRAQGPDGGK
jgi:nicotinate phosphoribosyltransferase